MAPPSRLRRFASAHLRSRATIALRRCTAVTRPDRFLARELLGRPDTVGEYTLRASGRRCVLRHRTSDLEIFHELLLGDSYSPPPEARAALGSPAEPRVVDLGGNIGMFGVRALATWPQVRLLAYEPDPENLRLLHRCIELNDASDRWQVVAACAGADDGTVPFLTGRREQSTIAWDPDAEGTRQMPVQDVLPQLDGADLVKIDIEGGEWPILLDERFPAVAPRALVMEYHTQGCPHPNAHGTAVRALERAGMDTRTIWSDPRDGVGLLWAWKVA